MAKVHCFTRILLYVTATSLDFSIRAHASLRSWGNKKTVVTLVTHVTLRYDCDDHARDDRYAGSTRTKPSFGSTMTGIVQFIPQESLTLS